MFWGPENAQLFKANLQPCLVNTHLCQARNLAPHHSLEGCQRKLGIGVGLVSSHFIALITLPQGSWGLLIHGCELREAQWKRRVPTGQIGADTTVSND